MVQNNIEEITNKHANPINKRRNGSWTDTYLTNVKDCLV